MNLSELVRKLLKNEKTREWILDIARLNDHESRMYLDVFKGGGDEATQGTKQEYEFLQMLEQRGILSEEQIVSGRGGKYSLFKITDKGKEYFKELKLRA